MNIIQIYKFLTDTELSELRDIKKTHTELIAAKKKIEKLEGVIYEYKRNKYTDEIDKDRGEVEHEIDYEKVFCIERAHVGTLRETTIIGHHQRGEEVLNEWYLECSRANHNRIQKGFAEYKKNKKRPAK